MSIQPDPEINQKNVLGGDLASCCYAPMTGFYRNGFCHTGANDRGLHTACVQVTDEFLAFSKSMGNDLSTPYPQMRFPGLKAGDCWCVCATRWLEAYHAGVVAPLKLEACHESLLHLVDLETLLSVAV